MPSTTNEALLDVNVLIAGLFEDHEHHALARPFVANLDRFYTCPIVQGGFLRFATRTGGAFPGLSLAEADQLLAEFSSIPGHIFLPDDVSFVGLPARWVSGHKHWTDAYLLHLARRHRLRFASLDGKMTNLDDPADPTLLVIS